ncbi:sensor domain-containing diguanylate cyclase [Pseudomonas sp. HMWF006]|uniref:sensor domain-containing diguanylate cyclase n=1 Tax=Pseudomonas sp. HMWF006 TaxID=2056843 RepID=UPI000D461518|nr:sensor domain-containing diguanylate cyclase [Pseudomonas sp. HMWF006]PTT00186.1 sensor domain-containing diguanylate cyclase [Pseudomonas sp. HMWF006]PTT74030.1 sensor domain-containing diguanylate cyclase [Pseudomonas sp. HMWF007]PTT91057.1 sensor domain-containing diguanylate cyclase [Pseudomonas sp. HMWF005]
MNDFENAAREVFAFLRRRLEFDLWMVTRKENDDWIVLHRDDRSYEINAGQIFRWSDSFCSEMIKGSGPRVAPDSKMVNAYSAAAVGKQFKIGAYIGVPILLSDGSLFGTLCALHPDPKPAKIQKDQELLELIGMMLSKILQMELKADEESSRAERFEAQALSDALTGLYNRAGWEQLSSCQDTRNKRYGKSSAVLVIDLDDLKVVNDQNGHAAGDDLIRSAANALLHASRSEDIVARLGGDEFAIIGVNCDKNGGEALRDRVQESLGQAGIRASMGLAMASAKYNISFALTIADQQMYEEKRLKKIAK